MQARMLLVLIFSALLCKASLGLPGEINLTIHNYDSIAVGQILKVEYFKEYSLYGNWPVSKYYECEMTFNTSVCHFKYLGESGYYRISFTDSYGGVINGRPFFVEAGDNVTMVLKGKKVTFTGPGSEKYTCQLAIFNVGINTRNYGYKGRIDSTYLAKYMVDLDQFTTDRMKILNQYKSKINNKVYKVIRNNIEYGTELARISNLRTFFLNDLSQQEKEAIFLFLSKYAGDKFITSSDDAKYNSNSYFDYLLMKEAVNVDLAIYRKKIGSKFAFLFHNIMNSYYGATRDRLLMSSILGDISYRDSTDYYRSVALKLVKDNFSKSTLKNSMKLFGVGTPAFNFKLQDSTGKYVRLTDFRGKIVILDFYFNGCHGCANLAKGMEEVIPYFKNNPNVVFVSISIDKKIDIFKNAIKSGKYTNESSVNLYTNGLGENHEIIRHYQIQGYPFLMIIDSVGNILESNPPYPNFGEGFTTKFIAIINAELKKIYNKPS
ncbi:thioredoxin-like domain-containing protein [Chitinophaga sp. CC14]|uniref:peroxiredoxin family protein n=1 Tax=Chitinophaga sp. CC14 TaxID=3029199 RepID=UPI003B7CAB64